MCCNQLAALCFFILRLQFLEAALTGNTVGTVYAEYKMMTKYFYNTVPRAASLKETLSIVKIFDPP
jgi:hypothetical protein